MKFSVIMPAHNAASYIRKALDSIISQEFTDYELIVVCDACEDNTAEIAREYTDNVIEVDYHRDGLARNAGLDVATGDWILFIDDDDWFLHEYVFDLLSKTIDTCSADIVLFDFIWRGIGYTHLNKDFVNYAVWSKAWRRAFIGDLRFTDVQYISDKVFFDTILERSPKFFAIPSPLYYYNYMREGSLNWELNQQ